MEKAPSIFRRIKENLLARVLDKLMTLKGVNHGRRCRAVFRLPYLQNDGHMTFGSDIVFQSRNGRVSITSEPGSSIKIGNKVYFNSSTVIYSRQKIVIGDNCRIGELCQIVDTDFHEVGEGEGTRIAPVVLGHNVWLGRNVTILAGVTIGDHAVVGTGSVVTRSIPERVLAAGIPAKVIRHLDASDGYVRS